MDLNNIECVSSSDGMEDDEIHHPQNHPHQYPSKPHSNIGGAVPGITPATSVHESLECPVCTRSMYPPIRQNNNRKRKQQSSSGLANSTGTGNTVGPSPNSPPSTTHTPDDGITTASSLQHVNSAQKGLRMYGAEATGLASSTNQLDDIDHFGDVESFLSNDGEDGQNLYGTLKQTLTSESSKGFSFGEVGCIRRRNKVTCCHFSSDGKLLASAGHDKKAVLWNMDTLQTESTLKKHQYLITDVRFRPNSSQLATASFDSQAIVCMSTLATLLMLCP